MDEGIFHDPGGLRFIKQRLAGELKMEIPPGLGPRLDRILDEALNYHPGTGLAPLTFDFHSITGESLVPSRDDSFGAGEFLKMSQVFERSLVGLIGASDLPPLEKARFIADIQSFFDSFDTALLAQLEDELIAGGLLHRAPPAISEPVGRYFDAIGFSKDLADEMTDPVVLIAEGNIVYANPAAEAAYGVRISGASAYKATGLIDDLPSPDKNGGGWSRAMLKVRGENLNAIWKGGNSIEGGIAVVVIPGVASQSGSHGNLNYLKKEKRRFEILYNLSRELLGGSSVDGLLHRLSKELSTTVHFDALLLHVEHGNYNQAIFHLSSHQPQSSLDLLLENSTSTLRAFKPEQQGEILRVVLNPEFIDESANTVGQGGTLYVLPLFYRNEVFGTLGMVRAAGVPLSDDDLHMFSAFSNQLSLALKNIFAVDEMRKLLRDNQEQLNLARRVQMGLLPEPGSLRRLKFSTLFRPAGELSGDFYHFFTGKGSEGIVIGDASGHGISASLIMAAAGAVFRDICSDETCLPGATLYRANKALRKSLGDDFFVVAMIMTVDQSTLDAHYASAGHAGPFLIKPDGEITHLEITGLPLGMFDNAPPYDVKTIKLSPGDRLLFYTDGATESRNVNGDIYGLNRLARRLRENIGLPGERLLAAVAADISSFTGDSSVADDMTLVLMEVD